MSSPAFEAYVAPARARPQLWRLVAGVVLTAVIYAGLIAGFAMLIGRTFGAETAAPWYRDLMGGRTPEGVAALLFSFVAMAIGPALAVRWLHKRPVRSLFGPRRGGGRAFAIAGGVILAAWLVGLGFIALIYPLERNLALSVWMLWLPVVLIGLLVQTGAEEVLFRGYMQQQLAARFNSPLVWMVIPSVIFGFLHLDLSKGATEGWLIVAVTALFGLIAADLAARTGAIWAGWGMHFANNLFALLILGKPGLLDGMALYLLPFDDGVNLRGFLILDLGALLALWAVLRWLLPGQLQSRGREVI
jgi:membrane protease YdiL (CAAX protease family)